MQEIGSTPTIPEGYTAYLKDPGETAIGYEEYVVWMDGLPVGAASFIAGQGSKALAVAQYLEKRKARETLPEVAQ